MPIHDWTRVIAGIFHDFHHDWITSLKRALNSGILPSDYYAMAEQIAGGYGPDVLTLGTNPHVPGTNGSARPVAIESGGVAVQVAPPKVRFTASLETGQFACKSNRVVIRYRSGDLVVAVLEIVSPGNKSSQQALDSFVVKAADLVQGGVHLLVADLFPPGPRDTQGIHGAIWSFLSENGFRLPADKPLTLAAYSAGPLTTAYIEPVAVHDPLPDMPLFLEPHIYVPVPLESTYLAAFEGVPKRWRDVLASPS